MGLQEFTISRGANQTNLVFSISFDGSVLGNGVSGHAGVRPVFNLESSVAYVSGSGTQSDPIRIN